MARGVILVPPSPFLDDDHVFPPLGALYIKRYVEENSGHVVDVVDGLEFEGACDVLGVSATTPQLRGNHEKVCEILEKTDATTVLGGPSVKGYAGVMFDHVVDGDGCKAFLDLLDGKSPTVEPDDNNQMPHRDEFIQKYNYMIDGKRATVIITGRGCPGRCKFCVDACTPVRLKSPEVVGREIDECKALGFEAIMFFDDLFCLNHRRVKALCEVIKEKGVAFRCFARADNFDDEMAATLVDAGCKEIGVGIESMDQVVLDRVGKGTTVQQNWNVVAVAKRHGLRVKAFMMIGLPGELPSTYELMEEFVKKSGIDDYDISVYYPYPGTELAKEVRALGGFGYYKGKDGSSEIAVNNGQDLAAWHDKILAHKKRGR